MPSERWTPEIAARWERYANMMDSSAQVDLLGRHLNKQKKAALVKMLVDTARHDRKLLRMFQLAFPQHFSLDMLAIFVRQAIEDATKFDERRRNYNFSYDHVAYEGVAWGLAELVRRAAEPLPQNEWDALEQRLEWKNRTFQFSSSRNHPETEGSDSPKSMTGLELAMILAIILVRKGSEQLAASDEGLMLNEIEDCIQPVVTYAEEGIENRLIFSNWLRMLESADECGVIDLAKMLRNPQV